MEMETKDLNNTIGNKGLPNVSQILTVWNGQRVDWAKSTENSAYPLDFVRFVEVMGATGGGDGRDCLKDPDDRSVLDDYDFSKLLGVCRGIQSTGARPYLKLGNVPPKFTADFNGGSFRMNIRPPDNHLVHYRYMKACAAALRSEFGKDEVRKWRFSVLTECDNKSWFLCRSGNREETREEFFKLYDYTTLAFEEELGAGIVIGTHLIHPTYGDAGKSNFTWRDVIRHCTSETNRATGKKGAPLRLLAISSYLPEPGEQSANQETLDVLADIRKELDANGFEHAILGVDEGRIYGSTPGHEKPDLRLRNVGQSYGAAYDVKVAKDIFNTGADYFAAWGYFSNGPYSGVPSHSYFTAREIAKFSGMKRIPISCTDSTCDCFAAISDNSQTVRVMCGVLEDALVFSEQKTIRTSLNLPNTFHGKTVKANLLVLDDSNNWFLDWLSEREKLGFSDKTSAWSGDDVTEVPDTVPMCKYAQKAASVKPIEIEIPIDENGNAELAFKTTGNGAAFFTIQQ